MEIYRRYAPALLRKGERLLGNPSDAEDIVQALFVDLLSKGETAVDLPYLFRAVTNRCLNLLRDRSNRARLAQRHADTDVAPARTRCDDQVIGLDLLLKLIDRLDARSVEILVYRFLDDLTQDEIAVLLSISRKTVGKRLEKIRGVVRTLSAGAPGAGA